MRHQPIARRETAYILKDSKVSFWTKSAQDPDIMTVFRGLNDSVQVFSLAVESRMKVRPVSGSNGPTI